MKKRLTDEFQARKSVFNKVQQSVRKDGKKASFKKEEEKFCKKIEVLTKLDVVVFFDEANTTDAIGLIKEIMCDRRINGKPVSDDLKFIAACNPYRKYVCMYVHGNQVCQKCLCCL